MFKILVSGVPYIVDHELLIKNQHLYIDSVDYGVIGFTFAGKLIEGEAEFNQSDTEISWRAI